MSHVPVPVKITDENLRLPLEAYLSEHLGRTWRVKSYTDLADLACHPAALLSDGTHPVFVKFSDTSNGQHQFEVEASSLQLLSDLAGVLVPQVIGILPVAGGTLLLMKQVHAVERTPLRWRQIGAALARLHQVTSNRFGLENNVFFGPLHQDNNPSDDWVTFYRERRLLPGLRMAFDAGNLPQTLVKPIEHIITRLPELCGDPVPPSLLHGDAQQNNFISAEEGACLIDPAVYYGHPEMDLAWLDAYTPVPPDVFDGYRERLPITAGFRERQPLWKLWGYLVAVAVEGAPYLGMLAKAVRKYA